MPGLHVLGTTPGSLAESLGMRAGDIILSCNDISLVGRGNDADGSARAASELRRQFAGLADGAAIRFNVRRGEQVLVFDGIVRTTQIPAVHLRLGEPGPSRAPETAEADRNSTAGCGRISVFDNAPTQRGLHPLKLISIDDRNSPLTARAISVSARASIPSRLRRMSTAATSASTVACVTTRGHRATSP